MSNGFVLDAVGDGRRERMLDVLRNDAVDPADLSAGAEVRVIYETPNDVTTAVCARVCGVCTESAHTPEAVHLLEPNTPDTYGRAMRIDTDSETLVEVQSKYSDGTNFRRTQDGGHAVVSDPNGPMGSVMFVLPADDVSDLMAHRHESGRTNFEDRTWLFRRARRGAIYLRRRTGRNVRPGDLIDRLDAQGGAECAPTFDLIGDDRDDMLGASGWDKRVDAYRGRAQSLMVTLEHAGGEAA